MSFQIEAGAGSRNGLGGFNGTASSTTNYHSTYPPDKAFDGTADGNMWISTSTTNPRDLSFSFPGVKTITKYRILPRWGTYSDQSPKAWQLRGVANGVTYNSTNSSTYTVLDSQSGVTSWPQANATSLNDPDNITAGREYSITTPGSYITYILYITDQNTTQGGGYWVSIAEMILYSDLPYVLEAGAGSLNGSGGAQGTVTDTYNHSTTNYQKDKAFDGDTQYRQGAWVPAGHSLTFQFPSAKTITMYRIWLAQNRANWTSAKDFTLQGSNDGSSFTTVDTVSNRLSAEWPISTTTSITTMNPSEYSEFIVDSPGSYTYYRISVTAVNNVHTQNWFGEVAYYSALLTAPDAPTNLAASAGSSTSVNLSWTASSSGSPTGYKIEESTDNSNWVTIVANTGSNGTSYTRTITHQGTYYYRVSGINSDGVSDASSVVNYSATGLPPSPPTGLTTSNDSGTSVTLSWTAGYSTVTGYKVEHSEDNSNWTVASADTGNTNVTTTVTGLSNSITTFYFRVSSIASGGTTVGSVLTAYLFLPEKPTNLTATKNGANANLAWTDPTDTGNEAITSYKIEYSDDNTNWNVEKASTSSETVVFIVTAAGGKYYINGTVNPILQLTQGSTYKFDLSNASNNNHPLKFSTTSNGTHNSGSEYSTGVTSNGTAGSSEAWVQIVINASSPTLHYYCGNHSAMGNQINTGTIYTFFGIASGTTYFRVSAISTAPGVVSDTASLNVTGSGHPVKATGVSASVARGASAVSWSAVSGATSYKILYSTNNTNWTVSSSSGTGTSHTVTGIAGDTLHYYKVAGINAVGLGIFSDAVSATTTAITEPGVPTALSWSSQGNSVALSWTAPASNGSAITGYKIEKSEDNSTWVVALSSTGSTAVSYTDAVGVFGGNTYYYRVSAINAIGTGSASSAVQVTVAVDTTEMGVHLGVGNNTLEHHFLTPHNGNFFAPEMDIHKNLRLNELSSTPTAPAAGEGIFLYTKTDKKLYYSSSQSSETILVGNTTFTKHGNGLATTTSLGINTNPSSNKKLYVGGTFGTTGTLTVGSNTFPKEDGAANHYLRTDGSGNLFWDSAGTPFTGTALTLTDVYSANLSSALQDTNAATTYYCWSSSVDTSDLKYTTGTTQGTNSLFHIKSPGDYTINAVIHLNDATADDRAGFHVIVRWYTGQNNNTTRGTAELDYSIGNAYVRSSTDPYDCAFPGGTLSRYVTQAQVSAGIQFEIVSLRLFSQDSTDDNPANQTLSKIRIEKTGINLS